MVKLEYVKSYEFVDDDFRFTVIEQTDSERFELWGRLFDASVSFISGSARRLRPLKVGDELRKRAAYSF